MFKLGTMISAAMMSNIATAQTSEYVVSITRRPLYGASVENWTPMKDSRLEEYGKLRQKAIDSYDLHKIIKLETTRNKDYSLFQKVCDEYSLIAFKDNARAAESYKTYSLDA